MVKYRRVLFTAINEKLQLLNVFRLHFSSQEVCLQHFFFFALLELIDSSTFSTVLGFVCSTCAWTKMGVESNTIWVSLMMGLARPTSHRTRPHNLCLEEVREGCITGDDISITLVRLVTLKRVKHRQIGGVWAGFLPSLWFVESFTVFSNVRVTLVVSSELINVST